MRLLTPLLIALTLLLWTSGQEFLAGLAIGLLAIKPHYCVPILLCVVLARAWRVLAGASIAIALLVLSTLPLGADMWTSYFEQFGSVRGVVAAIPSWKQITLLAFWRSVLGENPQWMAVVAAVLSAAPCIALLSLAWIRLGRKAVAIPRLVALASALPRIPCATS